MKSITLKIHYTNVPFNCFATSTKWQIIITFQVATKKGNVIYSYIGKLFADIRSNLCWGGLEIAVSRQWKLFRSFCSPIIILFGHIILRVAHNNYLLNFLSRSRMLTENNVSSFEALIHSHICNYFAYLKFRKRNNS